MNGTNVVRAVEGVGLPCAHMAFPEGSAPDLPWCVYYLDESSGFNADNTIYAEDARWVVEHYWKTYDQEKESALEQTILSEFGPYTKTETWVQDENCTQTSYYFHEIGE